MTFHYSHSGAVLLVSSVISLLIASYTYRRRSMPGGVYLFLMMISVSIFSFFAALEDTADSYAVKVFMSQAEYLGVVSVAPFWFLFTAGYSRMDRLLRPRVHALLWIIPAGVFIAAATNGLHGLVWPSITPAPGASGHRLVYTHGPLVWTDVVYSYLLIISGTVILLRATFRSSTLFRRQFLALFGAVLAPWLGNFLYIGGFSPPGLDLTPLAFTVTGALIAWGLTRYQILDIVPVAYGMLFSSMSDGVLVLDERNRIVNINTAAQRYLKTPPDSVGRLAEDVSAQWPEISPRLRALRDGHVDAKVEGPQGIQWFDIRVSPLENRHGQLMGRLFVFRDMTGRKRSEEALNRLVKEKDVLLRELQHRVKNNLNVVYSLIGLELGKLTDERSRNVFISARSRIRSMSGIYEMLYQSPDIDMLDLHLYMKKFVDSLYDMYVLDPEKIHFSMKLDEMKLDLKRAVPLGLILNELISNALKYAYPEGKEGVILIELKKSHGAAEIRVSDNGAGLPRGFSIDTTDSMGFTLVRMLASQIEGTVTAEATAGGGTTVMLRFAP